MVPKEKFEIFLLKNWFGWVYMDHNGSHGESIFQDFEKTLWSYLNLYLPL
jgi:hypothetical protein